MNKPNLSFWQMWNLSFGFFGVQMAFALQTSQNSRIFETLGADPHNLSYFWILPPLMGMIVQPIVGSMSDKTWCKWGRRKPYLYIGTLIAAIAMFLFPNSGSLNLQSVGAVMAFGATMLMLLDTSLNMAMQPFKMMVGDMVNDEQKAKAYSIQSMLCNAGQVIGSLLPKLLALVFAGGVVVTAVTMADSEQPEAPVAGSEVVMDTAVADSILSGDENVIDSAAVEGVASTEVVATPEVVAQVEVVAANQEVPDEVKWSF
ncbi:MAG: MFS transporter, partial [Alistipes sp.]|nr:MFS transporter [Alistipes sp.]